MEKLRESWDYSNFELVEAATKRKGVLGTWSGDFFFANLPSRNKRVYPAEAWKNALSNINTKRLLENRLMFGTIGHDNVDFDTLIRENKVSHVTTKLAFDEKTNIGKGEIDILDTPVGRVLHTLLQSGSKLCVSSKAMGEYKGEDAEGNQKVDPNNFRIERWDGVVDPGYLQAQPEMREQLEEAYHYNNESFRVSEDKESLGNNINTNSTKEDTDMSKELAERLMEEKVGLEGALSKVAKELELSEAKNHNYDTLTEQYKSCTEKLEVVEVSLGEYDEFFEEVGDMDMIKTTLIQAKTFGESVKEHGTIAEIGEKLVILEAFLELSDSPEDVEEALNRTIKLNAAIFNLVECEEGENAVEKIKEALTKSSEFILNSKDEDLKADIAEVAAIYGVEEDSIENLVKAEGKNKASAILESLKSGSTEKTIIEDKNTSSVFAKGKKSRASRMMENFGG